ncbi:F-box only protein 28 [Sitodiplosis mosellana]|uniref:F-box only protein 28 n=1 Tax=Sitodiplosis mosellana TaxID=263140 RepID=UPI002444502B|nr:F-box only protein 28 [Sitodiplosis mosellana]
MNLLDLPDCMLEQVLELLSYDEIAKQRIVCQKFNTICQGLLNVGFHKMIKHHGHLMKLIKSQLPRRESERRNHPLAKHSDVLTCIETRISMLSMTYTKYIEVNLCCFIPGKVIDEVLHVLCTIAHSKYTKSSNSDKCFILVDKPLRTHEVLQELRDISSMAIEHFEEKVAPTLKKAYCELPTRSLLNGSTVQFQYTPTDTSLNASGLSLPALYSQLQQSSASSSPQKPIAASPVDPYQSNYIRMERKFKTAMRKLNSVIGIQNRQAQKLRSCSMQIDELNAQVIDLRRRLEESNNLKNPLEQIATVVSGRTTRSTAQRNIKPRTATIILKRIAETQSEAPIAAKKTKH